MTISRSAVCLLSCLAGLAALGPAQLAGAARSDDGAVSVAGRVMQPDGTLQGNTVVVVRGGKIQRVVKNPAASKPDIRRYGSGAVICPGLVDLFSSPSAVGQTVEDAKTVDPDATPRPVLDPGHRDFRAALRAGITCVMVGPSAVNLVNGSCVTLRTHVVDGELDILRDDGPLVLAFGEAVWRPDRAPTSRSGALYEFRKLVADSRKGTADPRLRAAFSGQLDAWIFCPSKLDVLAMRQELGGASAHFGIVHTNDIRDAVETLKSFRSPVVVGPYSMETKRRVLLGAAALAEAGVEIAFRGGFPESAPEALRLTASLAVRHGLEPAVARQAITIRPAQAAGVADRLGSIAPGKDADLVVFSDDPLRLDAQVLEVYVKGVLVYSAEHDRMPGMGAQ